MFALREQVVLISGASRGLGRALAVEFARQGASVVINSRPHSANGLTETEQLLRALNAPVLSVLADVSQRADVERLAGEALARFGRVDILFRLWVWMTKWSERIYEIRKRKMSDMIS